MRRSRLTGGGPGDSHPVDDSARARARARAREQGTFSIVPHLDNPAGRLHELLTQLCANPQQQLLHQWGQVLEVSLEDVPLHLGDVGALVREIDAIANSLDVRPISAALRRYRPEWSRPIFPTDVKFTDQVARVAPSAAGLEALDLLAEQLHMLAPEGQIPDESRLEELRAAIVALIEDVRATEDFSADIRHLIEDRLRSILHAIDHVAVGGPEAVRLATEALLGGVGVRALQATQSPTWGKMLATLGAVWIAFSAGPTVQNSIDAWGDLRQSLVPAVSSSDRDEVVHDLGTAKACEGTAQGTPH